jgi:PST family polysaccharide transporter/lipopolysaccharide exporter
MTDPRQKPQAAIDDHRPPEASNRLADMGKRAGSAVLWQAAQHGSEKAINLARLLILAAILTPDDFGLLAVSLVALTVFTALTELGMTQALIQRPAAEDVHYDTVWTFGILRGVAVAVLVALAAPWFAEFLKEPRAVEVIRVLGLSPLLQSLASVRVADLMRNLRFAPITILRVSASLVSALTAVLLASRFGVWALVAGVIVGPTVFSLFSYLIAPYRPRLRFDWTAGRSLIQFGQWIFLSGLISMAGTTILSAIISRRLGTIDLGLYFLAYKLTFALVEVGQQIINNVAFPLYARLQDCPQDVSSVSRSILVATTILLVPPFLILIVLAPALPDIFGAKWAGAVLIVQIFCFAHLVGLFGDTAVPLLLGLGRPNLVSVLEVLQSSVMIIAVLTLTGPFALTGAVSSWVIAYFTSFLLAAVFVTRMVDKPFKPIADLLIAILLVTAAGGLLAGLLHLVMPSGGGAVAAGLISLAAVWGALWLVDSKWQLELRHCVAVMFPSLAPQSKDLMNRGG